jgi:translation elongation factor EF-G
LTLEQRVTVTRKSRTQALHIFTLIHRQSLKRRLDRTANEVLLSAQEFDSHIEHGFQLATFQGPLCAEPVEGLAYFVEYVGIDWEALRIEQGK